MVGCFNDAQSWSTSGKARARARRPPAEPLAPPDAHFDTLFRVLRAPTRARVTKSIQGCRGDVDPVAGVVQGCERNDDDFCRVFSAADAP